MKLKMPRWSKWTIAIIASIVGAILVCIIGVIVYFIVATIIAQRGKEIMRVTEGNYEIRATYYPGGLGTNNRIKVEADYRFGDSQQLVWSIGGDTVSVRFLDSAIVEVKILTKIHRTSGYWYWHTLDSAVYDLTEDNETRRVGDPGSG